MRFKGTILIVYVIGCGCWLLIWNLVRGYELMSSNIFFWFPFLSCFIIFGINAIVSITIVCHEDYEVEMTAIEFVERNAAHMVTAISGVLVIATVISQMKSKAAMPKEFITFQSIAFICTVVGVLPLYWIPSKRVDWLVILRHCKTIPFTYAISLFLAGLIGLLHWM